MRQMRDADADHVLRIYQEGMATGHATFQETAPFWAEWNSGHLDTCRIVGCDRDEVVGWAALSAVSSRPVYRGVCEVSIYTSAECRGVGLGRQLLQALIAESESAGIWTLQAGIFPENEASIRLHEKLGFVEVGRREKIGLMSYGPRAGCWRDVLLLERRSAVAGID